MRALIRNARPLRVRGVCKKGGLDFRSVASFLICLAFVLVIYFTELEPQKHRLEKAQHAMCGGNLDFVYHARDAMGEAWWVPTKSQNTGLPGGMVRFPGIDFPEIPYAPVLNHTVLCTLKRLSCDEISYTRSL